MHWKGVFRFDIPRRIEAMKDKFVSDRRDRDIGQGHAIGIRNVSFSKCSASEVEGTEKDY